MMYRILHNGQPIGTSQLESRDSAMAVAFGKFHPLPAYDSIRSVFLMFTEAQPESGHPLDQQKIAAYYTARDALGLSLMSEDSQPVRTGHIHIVDWGQDSEEELEVEVHVLDGSFWDHG